MPKVFHCSKCQEEHVRPVGKKCMKTAGESFSSADPMPAPPSPGNEITASDQILLQLRKIGEKMEVMDRRVQRTEAALEQGSSHVSLPGTSQSQSQYDTVLHGTDMELATFLSMYNGVSFFQYPYTKTVHLDACTTGLGAIYENQVYALQLPNDWSQHNIAQLEMINILVALKVWHNQWLAKEWS